MTKLLMALLAIALMAGPAFAFRCPLLVKQVDDEASNRFDVEVSSRPDALAYAAQGLAAEATALHQAGKHAEAMRKMEEAYTLIGLTFPKI